MKALFNEQQYLLLEQLATETGNIIVVTDKFNTFDVQVYWTESFEPNTKLSDFATMKRFKRITSIIATNSTYNHSKNALVAIITQIDKLPTVDTLTGRDFSMSHFAWFKF